MAARNKQNPSISDLPESSHNKVEPLYMADDVVESIVTFLPPDKITQLSSMSSRFRYTWKTCRNLSFDCNFAKNYTRNDYINIVNQFFHYGGKTNIDKFLLCFDPMDDTELVASWIDKYVDSGIRELEIDLSPTSGSYVMHFNLLEIETLEVLRLTNVDMSTIPLYFDSNVREIRFNCAKPKLARICDIFLNCLKLRTFKIMNCISIHYLNICAQNHKGFKELVVKHCINIGSIHLNAPTLCSLHYHGKMCKFVFYSYFPRLEDVILAITPPRDFHMVPHFKDLVLAISNVRTLTVTNPFLEMHSMGFKENESKELDFYLMNLEEFHLIVLPESYINPFDIAMFLKKCPRVERVFIDLGPTSFCSSIFWELHGRASLSRLRVTFPFMRSVKMKGFTVEEQHVTMARFFLKFAKDLESLIIIKASGYDLPEIFTPECMRWGIDSHAQIKLYQHFSDMSGVVPKHLELDDA